MTETSPASPAPPLPVAKAVLLAAAAVIAFELAYYFSACGFLIVIFLYSLIQSARLRTARQAFYFGLVTGFLAYVPQSLFFWTIFGPTAIALWLIIAVWIGLFVALARLCFIRFGRLPAVFLIPYLWTGLEYFRSELYYLRFSWLNVGYAFANGQQWLLKIPGVYGIGFFLMAAISLATLLTRRARILCMAALLVPLAVLTILPPPTDSRPSATSRAVSVAGVQMEFPSEPEIIVNLNRLIKEHPQAQLLLLSEYSVDGTVPDKIKAWCAKNQRYLVIGGKDPAPDSQFYDTAFVVDPHGDIVFRQAKCVPVQFFKDGLPAREQTLWKSPWGKIGICICYDLSYARVTDELVRLGARAMIVPSMDALEWGRDQHKLHARVARVRAAEYGIPVFRLASSGISQFVNQYGRELATAPVPGNEATLFATLELNGPGRLPLDRVIAPISVGVTALAIIVLALGSLKRKPSPKTNPT